jgi:simple sugar transport system substrate-binding protein
MTDTDRSPSRGSGDSTRAPREQSRGITRRDVLKRAALAGTLAGAVPFLAEACTGSNTASAQGGVGDYPKTPTYNFVFVNHVTTNPFFVPTRYGIEDANALYNCSYQWTGSETSKVSEMVNAMNSAVDRGVDGIAVAIVDPKAFNDPINRAYAKGIPVVAYNANGKGTGTNPALAYVGQDLFQAGFQMGQRIVDLVGSGLVGLFIATPGQLNIQPRIDGAASAIKQSGANITYKEIATGAEVPRELSTIDAWYQGHKDVKGMFAVDGGSTQSVGQVMDKYGLHDKGVKGGGFDLLPRTLELIKKGAMDFTIDQQPYLQGFIPVEQLFIWHITGGLLSPSTTNTGLKFVTQDNVDPYLTTKSRYEGSAESQQLIQAPSTITTA